MSRTRQSLNTSNVLCVIMGGGQGTRLFPLTKDRAKPAVPLAGKYRLVDIPISNCINSGFRRIYVLTQFNSTSLHGHISRTYKFDHFTSGFVEILAAQQTFTNTSWYEGTADAVRKNLVHFLNHDFEYLIILSGDQLYRMDFQDVITQHIVTGAEITVATMPVGRRECHALGIMQTDSEGRITRFVEKPKEPPSTMANMGVYVFNLNVLDQALWEDKAHPESAHDFGKNILPQLITEGKKVFAYPYSGYWVDVGTIESYWQAHMDLLVPVPPLNLNDRRWVIHTRTEERPPAWIERDGQVINSMLSDGCIIEKGTIVERSVLSPGVVVRSGAVVRESILLTDCRVEAGAMIEHAILDKRVEVGENSAIGKPALTEAEGKEARAGLVLVGKNSKLPAGIVIHPGAVIGADVVPSDFEQLVIESGSFIQTKRQPFEVSD